MSICRFATTFILVCVCCGPLAGQQVTIGSPNVNVRQNFSEQFGVGFNFGFRGGRLPRDDRGPSSVAGLQFNQGGFGGAQPAFGGFDPANQTTGGIQIAGGGFTGNLAFSLGQGSSSTLTSTTPTVTVMNGQPGMIADQVQRPFLLSVTPVVNGRARVPQFGYHFLPQQLLPTDTVSPVVERYRRVQQSGGVPSTRSNKPRVQQPEPQEGFQQRLTDAQQSTAGQGALSVSQIRKRQLAQAAGENSEALESFQRGQQAEEEGKIGAAKIFYRMASRRATGELKQRVAERLYILSESDRLSESGR